MFAVHTYVYMWGYVCPVCTILILFLFYMLVLVLFIFVYKMLHLNNAKEVVKPISINKASCFVTHIPCMHVRVNNTPLLIHERAFKALENTEFYIHIWFFFPQCSLGLFCCFCLQ